MNYLEYLESESWKWIRREVLHRDEFRCVKCGSGRNLDVHHTTYENLTLPYNAPLNDHETLCRSCHTVLHDKADAVVMLAHCLRMSR